MEDIRINKYLSECGYCSRRAADKLLQEGRVSADGVTLKAGDRVNDTMDVRVDGVSVHIEQKRIILAFNKPAGIVCTADHSEKNNIVDYIDYPIRIYPVGRLDKESRGLIFLTNDGEFANHMTRARYGHEKEYIVTVDKNITSDFIHHMSEGVYLHELHQKTRKCHVRKIRHNAFSIILMQGLNRQIRRMCSELGYEVRDLRRIRIDSIALDDLGINEGEYREVTDDIR